MNNNISIITENDLRQFVELDLKIVDIIEKAFEMLASGKVIMPPILSMDIPQANAEVDVKTAFIPGFESFAIKVSPGFFDNPQIGLASTNGLMILFSAKTGMVKSVLLDNGYLTDIRTAAAGAVAARHLAPRQVETAGVIGTGVQARMQMQAAHLVRPFSNLLVWGRDMQKANICAEDLSRLLNIDTSVCETPEELVKRCQLVVTTTPSRQPIIKAEWLHPGLHITAMGSDQEEKGELEPQCLVEATKYVCDRVSQCEKLGELQHALDQDIWRGTPPPELGEIITGQKTGRTAETDVTICDLTGTGAQDTAIASHAVSLMSAAGAGVQFST